MAQKTDTTQKAPLSKRELLEEMIGKKKLGLEAKDYQKPCLEAIAKMKPGSSALVVAATGLGKTFLLTHAPRPKGAKVLIISSGQELVLNPLCYYDCPVGVEMGEFRAKRDFPDAEVISASVQSLSLRLDDYDPEEFYYVIVDEAHHAPAKTYRRVIEYFKPKFRLGFTATPNRMDGLPLSDLFERIIFNRPLPWAIKNGYLCDIYARKVQIDVDLRNVKQKENVGGERDYTSADLGRAMANCAPFIADIYKEYAFGPTIVNVASVELAHKVAKLISGAVAVTGEMRMREREKILQAFRDGEIPCLVSVSVLREGVDLPNTTTIIQARPTCSSTLYTQIIGRGLRLYEGKKFLNLVEVEGILGPGVSLCSAPRLMGINTDTISEKDKDAFNGCLLTEMEEIAKRVADTPDSWKLNAQAVQSWADTSGYDMHSVNWFMLPDGRFELTFRPKGERKVRMELPAVDPLGRVLIGCHRMPAQVAFDKARELLDARYTKNANLWDLEVTRSWESDPATPIQIKAIHNVLPDYDTSSLTKKQASNIITRLQSKEPVNEEDVVSIQIVDPDEPPTHFRDTEVMRIDRQDFIVYDYDPGPGFVLDANKKTLTKEYIAWLATCVTAGYKQERGNLNNLIDRINRSKRAAYAVRFLRVHQKYRYIVSIDGNTINRRDLTAWLGKTADVALPRLIDMHIVRKDQNLKFSQARPNMKEEPFSRMTFEFPESASVLSKAGRGKLPALYQEMKDETFSRWEQSQRAAEKRKADKKRPKKATAKNQADATVPKKRGRPPKEKPADTAAPKKRGRPPKAKSESSSSQK